MWNPRCALRFADGRPEAQLTRIDVEELVYVHHRGVSNHMLLHFGRRWRSDPLGLVAVVALEPGPEHVPYMGAHAWALALGELRDPFQHPDVVLVPPRVAAVTWRLSVEVEIDQREAHARHPVRIIR